MEDNKTTLTNFVKYLEENNVSSARLLHALKILDGSLYDYRFRKNIEDIREIDDHIFLNQRHVGKAVLAEFNKLKINYLQNIDSEIPRELNRFWLRSDISKTLRTIEGERDFIEMALLEKFERDGIELVELK